MMSVDVDMTDSPQTYALELKSKGDALYSSRLYKQAVELYTQALNIDPQTPGAHAGRAAAWMMVSNYRSAAQDWSAALNIRSSHVEAMTKGAACNLILGQFSAAEKLLQRALEISPSPKLENDLRNILAVEKLLTSYTCHVNSCNYQAALNDITKVFSLCINPTTRAVESDLPSKWRVYKARALVMTNNLEEASQIASDLVRNDRSNPDALALRGLMFYMQGDSGNALTHLQQALVFDPDMAEARTLFKKVKQIDNIKERGNAAFKSGDLTAAYSCYTEALALDPNNKAIASKLYSNRAMVLAKQGKHTAAIADCTEALEIDPKFLKVLLRRADCYAKTEQWEAAARDYSSALDIDPTSEVRSAKQNAEQQARLASRKDYYKILDVSRDASDDEIKKAYRKLALKYHPDKTQGCPDLEAKFKDITEAYEILTDPQRRRQHDLGVDNMSDMSGMNGMGGTGGMGGMSGIDPEFINMFFSGGGMRSGMRGGFPFGSASSGGFTFIDEDDIPHVNSRGRRSHFHSGF